MAKPATSQDPKIDFRGLTDTDQAFCQRVSEAIREELDERQEFLTFVFTPLPDGTCTITIVGDACPTFAAEWITRYFQQVRGRGVQ